jgi:hypothetical protein
MEEPEILSLVARYLISKGGEPERVTSKMYPSAKIPDFRVKWGNGGFYYCEVKSSELILDPEIKMYKHDTTMSKLRQHLHTAVQQFDSVNPSHIVPNIIIWTSENFQLNWHNFMECARGTISIGSGMVRDLRRHGAVARTAKDWERVDIHVWLQHNVNDIYQQTFFGNSNADDVVGRLLVTLRSAPDGTPAGDLHEMVL